MLLWERARSFCFFKLNGEGRMRTSEEGKRRVEWGSKTYGEGMNVLPQQTWATELNARM